MTQLTREQIETAVGVISFDDVRLTIGEGKVGASDVLVAVNTILAARGRALISAMSEAVWNAALAAAPTAPPPPDGRVEELVEAARGLITEANRLGPQLPYNAPTKDIAEAIDRTRRAISAFDATGRG